MRLALLQADHDFSVVAQLLQTCVDQEAMEQEELDLVIKARHDISKVLKGTTAGLNLLEAYKALNVVLTI